MNDMNEFIHNILRRFQNPQVIALMIVLLAWLLIVVMFGNALAPLFTALVVAYLLDGMIRFLVRMHFPRPLAFLVVFALFIVLILLLVLVFFPTVAQQLTRLLGELPRITGRLTELLRHVSESATGLVNPDFAENFLLRLAEASQDFIATIVTATLQGIPNLLFVVIYLVLVPFLIFFFLKDKAILIHGFCRFLPQDRALLYRVLRDADIGMGGYIRGKFWEMILIGAATYLVLIVMSFDYAFLLALLTALSVLIPYLGIAAVMVPLVLLSLFQWGMTWDAGKLIIAYSIVQIIDGNILAPLILGEAVRVHPIVIVLAILIFGSLWGLIGVFFAVPIAILIKSVLDAVSLPEHSINGDRDQQSA